MKLTPEQREKLVDFVAEHCFDPPGWWQEAYDVADFVDKLLEEEPVAND